ncbi:MAG: DUF1385 domain-containing protein [Oligoflexia bacterium]|nr:DUF1385 domain-containing protein [Oligoflexia bacterium]
MLQHAGAAGMNPSPTQFTSIGGQAVIEGVMMRSPHFIAVAVRRPDGKIVIRQQPFVGVAKRFPILRKPVIRGVAILIESMLQGMEALSYSARIGLSDEVTFGVTQKTEKIEKMSGLAVFGAVVMAFVVGGGLFVALPHFLAACVVRVGNPLFHLLDGILKMGILLGYVYLIAQMKDIYRVFQYHGAEHKSIYTFEAGEELSVENARKYTTLHPRCGTSFLFFLILISILVFSAIFPLLGLTSHFVIVPLKLILMLPVAGLSYEFIKLCACRMESPLFRAMIWPGMILQKLTTREPTDDQLEIALASLKQVLFLEKGELGEEAGAEETMFGNLAEIGWVAATAAEFPEV